MIKVSRLPSSTHHKTDTNKPLSSVLHAEVQFGRPNRGCDGVGICKITVEPVVDQRGKKCKFSKGQFYKQGNTLVLSFDRAALCSYLLKTQFRRTYFLIEEPVNIPLKMQLWGDLPSCIRPGQYQIEATYEKLKILIEL